MNNKLKRTWKKTVVAKEGITRNLKRLRQTTKLSLRIEEI
jgi:hypothetical protein